MRRKEIENLIKENFKDTALRIYELDNEDRKSLLAEYRTLFLIQILEQLINKFFNILRRIPIILCTKKCFFIYLLIQ